MDENFLREIQEDVKRQKWASLWEKHGRKLIALVVLILAVAIATKLWQGYQRGQHEMATAALLKAHTSGHTAGLSGNHAVMAGLLAEQETTNSQSAQSSDPMLVSLHGAINGQGAPKPGDAFYASHLEAQALQAAEQKEYAKAGMLAEKIIADDTAPASLAERAERLKRWAEAQTIAAQ